MVGAYQEILGDMHNLFGDTNSAVVSIEENGMTNIESVLAGDTVADVLRYVNLDAVDFMRTYEELVNQHIVEDERAQILEELQVGLKGYTYLEDFS